MQTISDLIDELGGVAVVARSVGLPLQTVYAWKTRSKVPADQGQALLDAARAAGRHEITSDLILRLMAATPRKRLGGSDASSQNAESASEVASAPSLSGGEGKR